MTEWTSLVQQMYGANKHKPGYKLGNAMKDAKKVYKKMKTSKMTKKAPMRRRNRTHRKK